ncbi:arylesterase [Longimonas halophila]|uniref:Arylesterase n=1 Tax=Longimonas halophila TaxID=1469170 RepID=A0A2H3P1Q5_9BACT|nr:arylesterase [Longimonas halophila]PEN07886.1 arylesterase [Longimonas halophila]
MKSWLLYLLFGLSVLLLGGCGPDRSNPASDASSTSDTTAQSTAPRAQADSASAVDADEAEDAALHVMVVGNSIAAGYGLSPEEAFPAHLQAKADSAGYDVHVTNAGLSGETTAGGLRRLPWLLRTPVDVLVLELGGNDGLRGIDPSTTQENLTAMVDTTRARNPEAEVLLAGMQVPPNLGADYTERFRAVYPTIADERESVTLIPFVLEGVAGNPELNQPDGIHPTAEGQRIVAQNVWQYLEPILERRLQSEPAT